MTAHDYGNPHLCQASESFRELVPIMVVVNLQRRWQTRDAAKGMETSGYTKGRSGPNKRSQALCEAKKDGTTPPDSQ